MKGAVKESWRDNRSNKSIKRREEGGRDRSK